MPQKYSAEQMAEALIQSNGIKAQAARLLGCSRNTVNSYIDKFVTVKEAYEESIETNTDFVESKLMEGIRAGNPTLIIFYLKTIGKRRGYIETSHTEHTGKDGGAIIIQTGMNLDDL